MDVTASFVFGLNEFKNEVGNRQKSTCVNTRYVLIIIKIWCRQCDVVIMITSGAEFRISSMMRDSSVFFFGALKFRALLASVCGGGGGVGICIVIIAPTVSPPAYGAIGP